MSKNNQKVLKILVGITAGFLAATYGAVLKGILGGEMGNGRMNPPEDSSDKGPDRPSQENEE